MLSYSSRLTRLLTIIGATLLITLLTLYPLTTSATSLPPKKTPTTLLTLPKTNTTNTTPPATFPQDILYLSNSVNSSEAAAWGDWDNDGDLDLAVGYSSDNNTIPSSIIIYENRNQTELTIDAINQIGFTITAIPVAQITDLEWGDWDGDGDLDLAIATAYNTPNYVYENENNQLQLDPANNLGWQSPDTFSSQAVAWGDYNNDGYLDLAIANGNQSFNYPDLIYENINGTTFTLTWQTPIHQRTLDIEWGDLDNDGDLDFAVAHAGFVQNEIFINTGSGFTSAWQAPFNSISNNVALADWNQDGYLDLAFGTYNRVFIYENDTTPTLSFTEIFSTSPTYSAQAIAWADWDGDNDLDLGVASLSNVRIIENNNKFDFQFDPNNGWGWQEDNGNYNEDIDWADWDGDGDLDFAIADNNRNAVYSNYSAPPITSTTQIFTHTNTNTNVRQIAWGDYDNDGDLDVATSHKDTDPIAVYENVNGQFLLNPSLGYGWIASDTVSTAAVAWGDWDNDGDLDLAVGGGDNYVAGQFNQLITPVYVYQNEGDGDLQLDPNNGIGWISDQSDKTDQVAWGDWDNDGDLDLAVANLDGPNYIYENIGGSLSYDIAAGHGWRSTYISNTTDIAWADWDNDGDLDLTETNLDYFNGGSYTLIYENDNTTMQLNPTNGWGWRSPQKANSFALDWGDWDADGDLDLAIGNSSGLSYVYENINGDLLINPTQNIGWSSNNSIEVVDIAWVDWDGDGDLDLHTTGGYGEQENSFLFENNGDGTQLIVTTSPQYALFTSWADFDQDGDLDWFSSNPLLSTELFINKARDYQTHHPDLARIHVRQPYNMPPAYDFATAHIITNTIIPITYTLTGDFAGQVQAEYSPNGGGQWFPAVAAPGSIINNPSLTSPNIFYWDTFASGFFGQSDNTILRFTVHAQPAYTATNGTYSYFLPHTFLWNHHSAQTTPFRLQGTNIQVIATPIQPDAYWSMELISNTNILNVIPNEPAATIIGSASITTTTPPTPFTNNNAISLSGPATTDGLQINNSPTINTNASYPYRTFSLWFNAHNTITTTPQILWEEGGATNGFNIYLRQNELYIGGWSGTNGWSGSWLSTTISANQWHHAAFVLDGPQNSFSFYLDGRLIDTTFGTTMSAHPDGGGLGYVNNETKLDTGVYINGGFYAGLIDEVRLYNRPFTTDEIRQLYTAGADQIGPVSGAFVYRIPAGQTFATPITTENGTPFYTNRNGYLQGNGQIALDDTLIAFYPVTSTAKFDVYYTSASPTTTGLNAHTVQAGGTQRLTVSPNNPLILYHLNISLEWDARQDGSYLQELQQDIHRAAEILYDTTNGQVALGRITIHQ
ncbi:MAG TPA: FG-GAP-like repeat-containing protein, partial [Anaerolineae bacterium]|nr:FG-GAP-like repeat-containing protein [Anaerolineae bacterium]